VRFGFSGLRLRLRGWARLLRRSRGSECESNQGGKDEKKEPAARFHQENLQGIREYLQLSVPAYAPSVARFQPGETKLSAFSLQFVRVRIAKRIRTAEAIPTTDRRPLLATDN
jgi:hypothetical protein